MKVKAIFSIENKFQWPELPEIHNCSAPPVLILGDVNTGMYDPPNTMGGPLKHQPALQWPCPLTFLNSSTPKHAFCLASSITTRAPHSRYPQPTFQNFSLVLMLKTLPSHQKLGFIDMLFHSLSPPSFSHFFPHGAKSPIIISIFLHSTQLSSPSLPLSLFG